LIIRSHFGSFSASRKEKLEINNSGPWIKKKGNFSFSTGGVMRNKNSLEINDFGLKKGNFSTGG